MRKSLNIGLKIRSERRQRSAAMKDRFCAGCRWFTDMGLVKPGVGLCVLMPKHEYVSPDHFCGQHAAQEKPNEITDDDRAQLAAVGGSHGH